MPAAMDSTETTGMRRLSLAEPGSNETGQVRATGRHAHASNVTPRLRSATILAAGAAGGAAADMRSPSSCRGPAASAGRTAAARTAASNNHVRNRISIKVSYGAASASTTQLEIVVAFCDALP
jgi:hypothetical protein